MVPMSWIFRSFGLKDGYDNFRGIKETMCTTRIRVLCRLLENSTACGAMVSLAMEEASVCELSKHPRPKTPIVRCNVGLEEGNLAQRRI